MPEPNPVTRVNSPRRSHLHRRRKSALAFASGLGLGGIIAAWVFWPASTRSPYHRYLPERCALIVCFDPNAFDQQIDRQLRILTGGVSLTKVAEDRIERLVFATSRESHAKIEIFQTKSARDAAAVLPGVVRDGRVEEVSGHMCHAIPGYLVWQPEPRLIVVGPASQM